MDSYIIENSFESTGKTFTDGILEGVTQPVKSVVIPLTMDFKNTGYSDLINSLAQEEKEKNVNTVLDKETMKFSSANYGTSENSNLKLKFHFINSGGTYANSYINAGFEQGDLDNLTNRLTKSFFKLDFYDSSNEVKQNFLFSEYLYVNSTTAPNFPLNRLYWLKRDTKFIDDDTYRELFIEALFFNAKDGTVRRFINRSIVSTVTLNEYRDNFTWRFAELMVLNPYTTINTIFSNDNRLFYVTPFPQATNGNTDNLITFVEIKIT